MTATPTRNGGVRARFLGGHPPPTLGRVFRDEEDGNEDDGDEQGRRARRRRHDTVNVRDTMQGQAVLVVVVVHGLLLMKAVSGA